MLNSVGRLISFDTLQLLQNIGYDPLLGQDKQADEASHGQFPGCWCRASGNGAAVIRMET